MGSWFFMECLRTWNVWLPGERESWQCSFLFWVLVTGVFRLWKFSTHSIPVLCALFCNHFYSIITFTVLLMDWMWDSREIKQVSPLGFWNEQLGGEWCQLFLYREGLVEKRFREERRGQIRNLVGAMSSLTCAVKGPQNHPQVQWFARRIQETQKNCCTHNYSLLQLKDTV